MNANELAEVGSWLASHAPALIYGKPQWMDAAKPYWSASRCRLQRWTWALRTFRDDLRLDPADVGFHNPWPAMEIVIQEIFTSDLLSRVWSATMVTHDWCAGTNEFRGLAESVHWGHAEARERAARAMVSGRALGESSFDRLSQLGHRIERWTDLFLAQLPPCPETRCFAFRADRVSDFRAEHDYYDEEERALRQQLLTVSMRADLASVTLRYSANPDLNRSIAAGVVNCFPANRFDSMGLPRTARMLWLEQSQWDASYFVEKLLELERNGTAPHWELPPPGNN